MTKLIVMVGIQGSGKSTQAKVLADEYNAIILSSDELRKLYPDWNNEQVFDNLYSQMIYNLGNNTNVILDATNITLKSRRKIFEHLKYHKIECEKTAYIMNTKLSVCADRVATRNEDSTQHHVPLDVVDKYAKMFQIPIFNEGFDAITLHEREKFDMTQYMSIIEMMKRFDQESKHHKHSLLQHCQLVGQRMDNCDLGIFHDIGKLFTKTKDENGEAHYYNHAELGAYMLMSHTNLFSNDDEILTLITLTNYHMLPFNWKTEKTHKKYEKIFGTDLYNKLIELNEKDKESCE